MEFFANLEQFHFLRPAWLLLLIPALLVFVLLLHKTLNAGQWQQVIDAELLPHVLDQAPQSSDRSGLWLILFAWLIATLAVAGPSWQKLPAPVTKNQDALVILLDMSLSMGAQDIKPDRATRAIQKVTDIVRARKDGLTALLTYSGEAHTVTPLTDDNETIENLLPAISPFIMPKPGSRPDKAIQLAQQLVTDAGINKAQLLLITDGIINKDIGRIEKVLDNQRFQLSVITLGTKEGAPIAMPNSGFLRDGSGNIVLPKLELQPIRKLASTLPVSWQPIRYDDSDWQQLLSQKSTDNNQLTADSSSEEKIFDQWSDQGYWLILLLLPVTLLMFRRGVLFSWLLLPLAFSAGLLSESTQASESEQQAQTETSVSFWNNLWQTPDQQGAALLEQNPAAAAEHFDNANWKGVAKYNAGDFAGAAQEFTNDKTAAGHYNRANALAQAGELEQALTAYDQALQLQPDFPDATSSRAVVEQALQQQKQQQQNQKSGDSQPQDNQQQGEQQQDSQQNNSEQQNSQQQSSQQQNSQQQNSEQQSSEQQQSSQSEQQNSEQGTGQSSAEQQQADKEFAEQKAQQLAEQDEPEDDQDTSDTAAQAQQQDSTAPDKDGEQATQAQAQQPAESDLNREEQAAMQQWLNRIPDNPGNLLQRKFLYQYRQNNNGAAEQQEDVLW